MALAMYSATVLFPHPAGPVINQICLVSGRAKRGMPLDIVVLDDVDVEIWRLSEEVGVAGPMAGRFSYDNIIFIFANASKNFDLRENDHARQVCARQAAAGVKLSKEKEKSKQSGSAVV